MPRVTSLIPPEPDEADQVAALPSRDAAMTTSPKTDDQLRPLRPPKLIDAFFCCRSTPQERCCCYLSSLLPSPVSSTTSRQNYDKPSAPPRSSSPIRPGFASRTTALLRYACRARQWTRSA